MDDRSLYATILWPHALWEVQRVLRILNARCTRKQALV